MSDLGALLKSARPRAVAAVTRFCGELAAAEDAVQDAIVRALGRWPHDGVPDSPEAWLIVSARRVIIDNARRDARLRDLAVQGALAAPDDAEPDLSGLDDDLLRLIFTCCHPALAEDARVALTLKVIGGLSTDDVAQAFLATRRTMEQRLARARSKLRDAGIGFVLPREADRAQRLASVLAVVYLIFNQGYSPRNRSELVAVDLCAEAIWLTRLLARLHRGEPEVHGLLALLLFQHSRAPARVDDAGSLVTLEHQDRRLWDRSMITEARSLLDIVLRKGQPGPYQTQAAIAALHCAAGSAADTDWAQIAGLYEVLERQQPSPVVTLNRAVAVAEADSAASGLSLLEPLAERADMQRYSPYLAALAELSLRCGDVGAARGAFERALTHASSAQEREHYRRRLAELAAS